jgi:hypothetical protein
VAWRGGSRWARPKKMAPAANARRGSGSGNEGSAGRVPAMVPATVRERRLYQNLQAEVDEAWNEHLHGLLGAVWPCPQGQHFDQLMADIVAQLEARGLGSGRYTYGYYSDAESSLCRAVWCTALHTRPKVVIETGVAHGVTSRVVLEALRQNELGHLWSVDLPFPFDHRLHVETEAAVTDACRSLWSYLEGTSRQLWRGRAGNGCRRWSPTSVTWRCLSMTVCTQHVTRCSRWKRPPRRCRPAGSC